MCMRPQDVIVSTGHYIGNGHFTYFIQTLIDCGYIRYPHIVHGTTGQVTQRLSVASTIHKEKSFLAVGSSHQRLHHGQLGQMHRMILGIIQQHKIENQCHIHLAVLVEFGSASKDTDLHTEGAHRRASPTSTA